MNRSVFFQGLFLLMIALSLVSTGCSTLQSWIGAEQKAPIADADGQPLTRFSETPTVLNPSNRQYRKMTRSRMEEESDLGSQAGSMWVMEGQGAYLFTQNKVRREGDLLNVKVEGAAHKQIETKVSVIKKLLKQLEEEELKAQPGVVQPPLADNNPNPKKPEGVYAHFLANKKSSIHRKLSTFLKPGGTVIFEAFSKRHLEYIKANPKVGGPREVDMLFSKDELAADFSGYEILLLEEMEVVNEEGQYHSGASSVIRFVGRKPKS